jgi:predicted aspartyl protease
MSQQTDAVSTTAVDDSQGQDVCKSKNIPIIPSIAQLMRIPVSFSNLKTHALIDTGAAASFLAHRLLIDIPYKDIEEITGPNRIEQLFKTASGELVRPIGRYKLHMKLARRHPFSHTFFVMSDLEEGCILGYDFLEINAISVNPSERSITYIKDNETKKLIIPS